MFHDEFIMALFNDLRGSRNIEKQITQFKLINENLERFQRFYTENIHLRCI